jgi:pyruvate/2-oxoacid:ferredoxin oxidoreductase alpha subunit
MEYTNKLLVKGNEAVVYGALLAGCECFFGYPITPASEIAHTAANLFPKLNRVFLQAESEIAAINMVMGAAATGRRVMTASSGLGISLKQECISYLACSELPVVIVDIMRGGPGLGNIGPEQSDYNQVVKGGGHGSYKCIVLAPNSSQEMCEFCMDAFDLADKYRTPVYVLADGVIGQMLESVELPEPRGQRPIPEWAIDGSINDRRNMITSIFLEHDELEQVNIHLQEKYKTIEDNEQQAEGYMLDDADVVFVGYGIVSRVIRSAISKLRQQGVKAGMIRPKTLFPFPKNIFKDVVDNVDNFICVELSSGQMIDDIKLTIECAKPVHLINRMGGNIPTVEDIVNKSLEIVNHG